MSVALEVDVGRGLRLRNPVIAASGTFGYGVEYEGLVDLSALGAVVVKGLSLRPAKGHAAPRMVESAAGMLNAIGLQNVGLEVFLRDKLPRLRRHDVPIVVNCWGNAVEEYGEIVSALDGVPGVAALEINVSSPNKREWGRIIATDPVRTAEVVETARARTSLPLWLKLSPNVTDVVEIARVAEAAGADALSVANTWLGMAVDLDRQVPVLTNVTGGLSGPAIKPLNLRAAHQVANAVKIPVIGLGGIACGRDALEYLMVGARAVQVGTANLYDPAVTVKIVKEIADFLASRGIADVNLWVNSLKSAEAR